MIGKDISDKTEYLSNVIATQISSHIFDGYTYDECIRIVSQAALSTIELLNSAKLKEAMK